MLGILTKLAGFSLRNPKTVLSIATIVAVLAFGVHYKLLVGERDKLRVAETGYKLAVAAFERREATLAEDAKIAQQATKDAIAAREASRAALEEFRRGRDNDPESIAWGSQLIPLGEVARLCLAVPEMNGCD